MKIRYAQFAQAVRFGTSHLFYLDARTMQDVEMTFDGVMLRTRKGPDTILILPPNIAFMEPETTDGTDGRSDREGTQKAEDRRDPAPARAKGKAQANPV